MGSMGDVGRAGDQLAPSYPNSAQPGPIKGDLPLQGLPQRATELDEANLGVTMLRGLGRVIDDVQLPLDFDEVLFNICGGL
jgi:hypothetical protein